MRTCGCGERGRHKPSCLEITRPIQIVEKPMPLPRSCGCGTRGRHKKECTSRLPSPEKPLGATDLQSLYIQGYDKPLNLKWFHNKSKQLTVERRISSLVRRYRAFYLTIVDEAEVWYIDGGNWASRISANGEYNPIGHIKNILPFFRGNHPIPWGAWEQLPREIKPKLRRRRR